MCGICGIYNRSSGEPVSRVLLERMTHSLAHRGPDGRHSYIDRFVGLGHRRLAIIDRSFRAQQPMCNESRTVCIIFNGEIYNHQSLRRNLILKQHHFRSRSDTEVILHLYEDLGEDCLQYLRGMFALAIWDQRNDKLFIARDRLGQKPLYYTLNSKRFLFASEIKALLQDKDLQRIPNLNAIHHYLSLSYVPGSETAFQNIYKLPPAHKLVYQNGKIRISRYWRLSYTCQPGNKINTQHVCEEIVNRLRESVRIRLISDVPSGLFLSGGIDSSAIAALMTQLTDQPVKTFSIRFTEKSHDESTFARLVAKYFRTDHHEYTLTPDIQKLLPEIVQHCDEPFADPSVVPTYYLSEMASQHITVALNGDGGDEVFAGYDRYVKNKLATYYLRLPHPMRKTLAILSNKLIPTGLGHDNFIKRLQNLFQIKKSSVAELYCRWLFIFQQQEKRNLYTAEFSQNIGTIETEELLDKLIRDSDGKDITEATLHSDIQTYLADDLLVKMDRATMAYSMENRSPFLDHIFMEYIATLPSKLKLKGLTRKWIFKKAMATILPEKIIHRPKRGFGIPVDQWFRHQLKEMTYDTILSTRALSRGYFRPKKLREILDQHMSGQKNWQFHLWNLLVLELWHQKIIDVS